MKGLFDFTKNEYYKLMIDMSKENHVESEIIDIKRRFSSVDDSVFFDVCHEHELDGVVGAFAQGIGLTLSENWLTFFEKEKERQEYLKKKAIEICAAMDQENIPMVILKNGGIMISIIEDAVRCPMEDIDTLIRKKDFFRAHQILENHGFVFKFRSEFEEDKLEEAFKHGSSEYYLNTNNGEKIWFELSWRAIDGRWIRPDKEPDTDEFVDRSFVPLGTKAHILSPEDNLLQVCIHTAKHSYVRAPGLRLHLDVDRIVSHEKIDWDTFVQKVRDVKVTKAVYLSLYIPSILFGTKIPENVLQQLKPKNDKRLLNKLAKAELIHPHEKKFSRVGFLLFQSSLYDEVTDIFRVIFPGKQWMMSKYCCTEREVIKYTIIRTLDLVGIRKKK